MKTKLITGYWIGIANRPYVSSPLAKVDRYLGSLIGICKSVEVPVICYTQKTNLEELVNLKNQYNLNNLEIKIKELDDMHYVDEFKRICDTKLPEEILHLNGRAPEVMWGKFDVLRQECTEDTDYLYWVDVGLQSNQLMPYKYCVNIPTTVNSHAELPMEIFTTGFLQFNFGRLFNQTMLNNLERKVRNKIILLNSTTPQCSYYSVENYDLDLSFPNNANYPIGGFFGGDKTTVIEFCEKFCEGGEMQLRNNIVDQEQSVMKYAMDKMPREKLLLDYWFDVHVIQEQFHYSKWSIDSGLPKPLYTTWEEILEEL